MRGTSSVRRKSSITYDGEVPVISRNDSGRLPVAARFVDPVKSVEVDVGETACFDCKIKGNPTPDVQWFKDGVELIPADRVIIREKSGGALLWTNPHHLLAACPPTNKDSWTETRRDGRHSLVVKDTKSEDGGSYRCTVINKLGRDSSLGMLRFRKMSLSDDVFSDAFDVCDVINGRPEHSPEFIEVPQATVGEKGETVTFDCQVLGHPAVTIEWFKGSDKLSNSIRYFVRNSPGKFSLEISDLCSADAGTYRCVAANKIGKCSCSFQLIYAANQYLKEMSMDRAPSFSQTLTSMEVKSGERARFECRVEGKPKPSVSWRKDGRLLSQSTRVRIMEICGNHSLVLPRTEPADSGSYSFTASNKLGSQTTESELLVADMSGRTSTNQLSGSRRSSSHTSSTTSNLNSPSLSPKLSKTAASRLVTGNASPFGNLKSGNRGGGGASPRRRAPGFILRPRPQNILVGEKLSLKCTLLGHPKPTVTWEKDGELVDEERTGNHVQTRIEGNDYFLEIEHTVPDDAGKYCVTARNSLGKQTATVEVAIGGSNGVSKTIHIDKTPVKTKPPNTNGSEIRHNDVINHKQQSSSEEDRKPGRVPDLHIPSNSKPDDSKESPTSSISSTISSHSRISTSSGTSRQSAEADEHPRPNVRPSRRNNIVAPAFLRRLSSTQVLEGEELLLQCEVSGDPDPRLAWRRNGSEFGIDEDEVFTSYRDGVARLRLRDVQPQHAGEYVCVASNDAGSVQCSSRVTVKVKRLKVPPRFIKAPADVRVIEGETLTLEAEVEGAPSPEIVWSLDGEEVTKGEATFNNNVARLVLHKVSPSSSGQYMCSALNSSGEDSVACRVRVKEKQTDMTPEFTAPLSDVTTDEGYDVCLRCMVTGIPEPSVKWQCDGHVIEDEEGIEMTYQDGVAALTLEHATVEDSGTYACVAVNGAGSATTKCKVSVKGTSNKSDPPAASKPGISVPLSPPKFASTFDEYIRSQEDDTVELECSVTGNPLPEVTWTIDDKKIENSKISFENKKARIVISPITANHGGHIKCQLSNQSGKASHEARLYVRSKRVAPIFDVLLPDTITIHEGEEAAFECKVTGHPQPRLTWTRDGRSLSVLSTETSYEDGLATVRIRKAGPREAGKYVCVARNLSGEAETVCTVRYVEKSSSQPPQFTTTLSDVTLADGDDLHLQCKISGDPPPEVTWELDGHKFDSEEADISFKNEVASFTLEDAMPEDSGEYKCIAVSSAGKSTCSCHVTVIEAKTVEPVKPIETETSFPITLDDVTIKEGEDILLHCQVVGNPRPTITWLVDGDKITDAEIKYLDDGNTELLLQDAMPNDDGVYTCIAENPLKRVMTSCKVTIDALPRKEDKKKRRHGEAAKREEEEARLQQKQQQAAVKPSFIQPLDDIIVQDGSVDFELKCRVAGNPETRWLQDDEELSAGEDFQMISDGEWRKLVFAEVFPDDSGTYTCVISNEMGEASCSCAVTVQEIDGEAPTFLLKPKPVTVNAGGRAVFACRVDGDPAPSVHWMFCNQPIENFERARVTDADASNNYTHSLEIPQVSSQDAGRYSVCSRNLLGDVTCTVSLIVGDSKKQEPVTDFRGRLKPSSPVKTAKKPSSEPTVDYLGQLKTSVKTEKPTAKKDTRLRTNFAAADTFADSREPKVDYTNVLSTSVKTKTLTEEERKTLKADQLDFRDTLIKKIDTKVVTQDTLRTKETEQTSFKENLKTKVKTKELSQDELKLMRAEQKSFKDNLKTKVNTKAVKEEEIKTRRAKQMDFRTVLSPSSKREEGTREVEEGTKIADVAPAKWKKEVDHTTVSTKRARHRGAGVPDKHTGPEEEDPQDEEEVPSESKPEILERMCDVTVKDTDPFELVCRVVGEPRPQVVWSLDGEVIEPEEDIITIRYEDDVCRLMVSESVPEDQGKYTFTATNEHGDVSCHCYVTVLSDESSPSKSPASLPPRVTTGPPDMTVLKGGPIRLGCAMEGSVPLKVVWRKRREEIRSNKLCHIESSNSFSELCIASSGSDDSGCYTLQLSNAHGVDQFSVNVTVVDVPDPPGKPFADVRHGKGLVVSWYGCSYDGGSQVEEYKLEMAKVTDAKSKIVWKEVIYTNSTSHTVKEVEHGHDYIFRVSARNKHGLGKPGHSSDVVRYLTAITNGTESTDDENEDEFVKYQAVEIKENVKFSSKFEIHEKLGQGRFGKVHRVVDRKTGQQYAAKIMKALKAKDRQAVALEIEIMNQLRHPKLVQLIEAYQHAREVTMVMDLVAGGELFERVIDEDFELTEAACIKYMRQICSGVKFMHDNSIIHLDLKPENIMCVDKTGTRVKLIDFGLARKFAKNETLRVMFGTPEFVAPEVINYDAIGFQTDMWSVGVICYILLSGLSPFSGDMDSETLSNVTAASWDFDDEAFDQISEDAKDFISRLLVKHLKSRSNVDQALNHNWLRKNTAKMQKSKLDTKNLKRFLARRKWQKTGNAVRALGRLASLAKLSFSRQGQQRESGFLTSLRAELEREKEAEQFLSDQHKPKFIESFRNAEVFAGSETQFSCVITGSPEPVVTWFRDGKQVNPSRRFRLSYSDYTACLHISRTLEHDEGEYVCKAVNSEGEASHSARLEVTIFK